MRHRVSGRREPKRDGYTEHLRHRWPGIHGKSLPAIPDEPSLRVLLGEHPAYHLLVKYLDRFKLEVPACSRQLSKPVRAAMTDWVQTVESQKEDPHQDVPGHRLLRVPVAPTRAAVAASGRRPSHGSALAKPQPLSVVLGWVLMTLDNLAAKSRPEVLEVATDIVRRRNRLHVEDVFRWSYVPRVIIELLEVRLGEAADRRDEANAVRRLRRLQARELPEDADLPPLEPINRHQSAAWWKELGLNKLSRRSSTQGFWLLVFEPLIDRLLRLSGTITPRGASWRLACEDASRLVHARYPDLWEHRPDRLRKRYSYTPRDQR